LLVPYEAAIGDFVRARELLEECLAVAREVGDKAMTATALRGLAWLEVDLGHLDEARGLLEEALPIAREAGDESEVFTILVSLGEALGRQGAADEALAACEEAVAVARTLGGKSRLGDALLELGQLVLRNGEIARARVLLDEASACLRPSAALGLPAILAGAQGDLARAEGALDEARAYYHEALTTARDRASRIAMAACLARIAGLAALEGECRRAIELFGAIAAFYASVGLPLPYKPHPGHDSDLAAARSALGEDAFAAAWAEGRAITLEQAVEHALS
jgi:tetratricopeptide (TPR) repeat protein